MYNTGNDSKRLVLAITISSGVMIGVATLAYRIIKNYLYWNTKFVFAGKVKSLYIYPVKSFKGNKVDYLDCTFRGSKHENAFDRTFLIIDEKNNNIFLTARMYPKMVLIEANVKNNILTLTDTSPDGNNCSVSCNLTEVKKRNDVRRGKLFNDAETEGYDCGDEIGEFVTEVLNLKKKRLLRVLYYVDELFTERNYSSKPEYWINPVPKHDDKIAYADLASYLLVTTKSLQDLNEHLEKKNEKPINDRNFRPNILIENLIPFDEDRWLHIKIGEVEFVCYKPCTRCILITVDPDNGKKRSKMEPLNELRKYRLAPKGKLLDLYGNSPIFGVNMGLIRAGRIHVGDEIFVQYKPTPL